MDITVQLNSTQTFDIKPVFCIKNDITIFYENFRVWIVFSFNIW